MKCMRLPLLHLLALLLAPLFFGPSLTRAADPVPTYTIGIVTDGDTATDRELVQLFQKEIRAMAEDEFEVRFPEALTLSGRDSAKGVVRALSRLLASPRVDLVLALGPIASRQAFLMKRLPRPVVAPYLLDLVADASGEPQQSNREGTLIYIDSPVSLDAAITSLGQLTDIDCLSVMVDRREMEAIPEITRNIRRIANEFTMDVYPVEADGSVEDTLSRLPEKSCGVLVGMLYHFDEQQQRQLADGLIQRGLPSFSLWDRSLVVRGLLASDVAADMEEKLARRTAVAVQDLLLGDDPGFLHRIVFSRYSHLTINMATARALDVSPGLEVLIGSDLLHEQQQDIKEHLTLETAVREALTANLDLLAARRDVEAGTYSVAEARSRLLPQLGLSTGVRVIDEDRARLGGGSSPEQAWTGALTGSQQIYSDRKWTGYAVAQHFQESREANLDGVRLDIMYEAAVAYLDVLRARTIEQLYRDNLKLTQANLERARMRLSTGVAGPDEVYRWETKYSTDKINLLQRESITLDAMQNMNRILDRPVQELFVPEETDLSDPLLATGDMLFFKLMNRPRYLALFKNFSVKEALDNRPELRALDAAIKARERLKTAAGREFWLPEFSVEGSVEQYLSQWGSGVRDENGSSLDDTDWQVGVYARLPLFEGGRRSAALGRTGEELARLKLERQALAKRVVQNMLAALNRTRSSYPGISLSRDAADAARRNLNLITDSYVQGIKSIIDLLDAQNQALSADQSAANAVYNFLVDLMGVQRAMGEFVIFLPEAQRSRWAERARQALGEVAKK